MSKGEEEKGGIGLTETSFHPPFLLIDTEEDVIVMAACSEKELLPYALDYLAECPESVCLAIYQMVKPVVIGDE